MNSTRETRIDEHEWESQERGLRAVRNGVATAMDPLAESYRHVAAALDSAPRSEPPGDFAADMVMQIARQSTGIERMLFRGLVLALAASALIVTALYGEQLLQTVQASSTYGALQWIAAGSGCVALSWMASQLRRSAHLVDR